MQYMKLSGSEQQELLASLSQMSDYLSEVFSSLSPEQARTSGPDGSFSPVEQVWHLADLEREGFGIRITRLLSEANPHLPNFDGDAIALARDYRSLSLADGLRAFKEARQQNITLLQALETDAWFRNGTQEGVGTVSLCDIPSFMLQHDQAHKTEIEIWKKQIA